MTPEQLALILQARDGFERLKRIIAELNGPMDFSSNTIMADLDCINSFIESVSPLFEDAKTSDDTEFDHVLESTEFTNIEKAKRLLLK